jgi:hypothetical protein
MFALTQGRNFTNLYSEIHQGTTSSLILHELRWFCRFHLISSAHLSRSTIRLILRSWFVNFYYTKKKTHKLHSISFSSFNS